MPILGNTEWKATTAVFSAALFMPSTKRALVILCEHSRADTDADIDTNIERTYTQADGIVQTLTIDFRLGLIIHVDC